MIRAILSLCVLSILSMACVLSAAVVSTPTTPTTPRTTVLSSPAAVPTPVRSATVTAGSLNIREGATFHSPATGRYLHAGMSVIILGCEKGWAKVDGGFVNSYFLDKVCPFV